jgi:hypothetical protein
MATMIHDAFTDLTIDGLPQDMSETALALTRSRMIHAVAPMLTSHKVVDVRVHRGASLPHQNSAPRAHPGGNNMLQARTRLDREDWDSRGEQQITFQARTLQSVGDALILPPKVVNDIESALRLATMSPEEVKHFEIDSTGLITPGQVLINLYGPPGTGKTRLAREVAVRLGRPIIETSEPALTDATFGESGKRIMALFRDTIAQNAVLFVDDAEPLLSKRFVSPTQGAEQAINSMRSQLLIELERFAGVGVFATNLLVSYDKAYISRIKPVHVPLPGREQRVAIWNAHLPRGASRGAVDPNDLADLTHDFSGRNIRQAYLCALGLTLVAGVRELTMDRLRTAIEITCEDVRLERTPDQQ